MKKLYTLFFIVCFFAPGAQPTIGFQTVVSGFTNPLDVVSPPDTTNRLFVVEQAGKIKIVKSGAILSTPFLDAASVISYDGGERGLLSLAFHPNYAVNRYFFIYYTNAAGSITVARYQTKATNTNEADPASGVVLITISKNYSNHNGGKLNFGTDGYLYFGTGDGGSGGDPDNNAQNGNSLLGKMLRIDVNNFSTGSYSIPASNPYFGLSSVRNEVLALGVRNPFRWSFDRLTGDMWIADVGQNLYEEVDVRPAASIVSPSNYGWRCYEATHVYTSCSPQIPSNYISPVFEYGHNSTDGGYSITGGYVYRGIDYPSLQGYYLCSDYVTNKGWLIKPNGSGGYVSSLQNSWAPNVTGYGESQNGTLYCVSLNAGVLYKVTATPILPVRLVSFAAVKKDKQIQLKWEVLQEERGDTYELQQSAGNADNFVTITTINVAEDKKQNNYSVIANKVPGTVYYRLKITNHNGVVSYSSLVRFADTAEEAIIKAYRSGSVIQITSNQPLQNIAATDITGRMLYTKEVSGAGNFTVPINHINGGITIVHIQLQDGSIKPIKVAN